MLGPHPVQHVQVDVRQQRRDHSTLRRSRHRVAHHPVFHHPGLQPLPDHLQHPPVADPLSHQGEQLVVRDAAEVVLDVGVQHVLGTFAAQLPDPLQRLLRTASWPEPVRARREVRLVDRLQHQLGRHLHHPVLHRRDAQGPLRPVCLGYVGAPHDLRTVLACAQHLAQLSQETPDSILLDFADRHPIDARCALVAAHSLPRLVQDVTPAHLAVQRMEASSRCPLGCGPELPLQLSHFVVGLASAGVVRSGLAGHSLALTRSISMTTAGTLPSSRVLPHGLRRCGLRLTVRYYDPLGLPLRTARLRLGLIRARLPRPGPRRRASHVPHLSLHACCAPYPAAVTFALRISLG